MTPETPPTAASSGLPEYPELHIKQHPYMGNNNGSQEFVERPDYDTLRAHAASLSRKLAAKEGEIAVVRSDKNRWKVRAESAEQQLAEQAARVKELVGALKDAHEWLERVDEVRLSGGSYIGLDHKIGEYKHCDFCTALKGSTP